MTGAFPNPRVRAADALGGRWSAAGAALASAVLAAISWRFAIWWLFCAAVTVTAAVGWTLHRALSAWAPAAIGAEAVAAAANRSEATRYLSLVVASRGDIGALQRARDEVPSWTLDPHRQQAAFGTLDGASRHLRNRATRPPDQLLNRFAHPVVLLGGPPALVLSWEVFRSAVIDVAALSALAVAWVTLRERYQSVPEALARRAVDATDERPPTSGRCGDHVAPLCSAAQWTPAILERAAQLVALAAPHDIERIAQERLGRAVRMAERTSG